MGLFSPVQDALNTVWDVQPQKQTLLEIGKQRLLSFATVLSIAFLLLVSLGLNSLLTIASSSLSGISPDFPLALKGVDFLASLALVTALFSLMFKVLPRCRITWGDVWIGAAVSALLFVAGQFLLGWYLGRAGISSSYGAFGGVVVFLIWVNYSAQIMLLGAEFTHIYV
jgi:membrane protein